MSKHKFMIVDDEEEIRSVIVDSYSSQFTVLSASSGARALELLSLARVDLVITDFNMPDMDGLELAARIRAQVPDLPLIMLTGRGSAEVKARVAGMPRFDFVQKPFSYVDLRAAIESAFAGARTE